mmetsp:Transcript_99379/g.290071  ORF Transcript_99379/g.290071 Transcript_99379/m.290071 type:complete len:208 (-) Transcript_99379:2121-2744(-)
MQVRPASRFTSGPVAVGLEHPSEAAAVCFAGDPSASLTSPLPELGSDSSCVTPDAVEELEPPHLALWASATNDRQSALSCEAVRQPTTRVTFRQTLCTRVAIQTASLPRPWASNCRASVVVSFPSFRICAMWCCSWHHAWKRCHTALHASGPMASSACRNNDPSRPPEPHRASRAAVGTSFTSPLQTANGSMIWCWKQPLALRRDCP